MNEFSAHLKAIQNTYFFLMSFCLVCWAILLNLRPEFAGIILGTSVSMINAKYLAWKINRFTDMSLMNTRLHKMNLGFLTRAAVATLSALIAYKYQQHVNFYFMIGSYFFAYVTGGVIVYLSVIFKK